MPAAKEDSNTTPINIRMDNDLLEVVREMAGPNRMSRWIKEACYLRLEAGKKKEGKKG